jgi:hypothetical protein
VSNLPFRDGPAQLQIEGADGVQLNGSLADACVGLGPSGLGAFVDVPVIVTRDGSGWLVRPSTSAGGTFELRLHGTGSTGPREFAVAGSIRGVATNTVVRLPAFDAGLRASFGSVNEPDAQIDGKLQDNPFGSRSGGMIQGRVVFSGPNGASVACNPGTVSWNMGGP